MKPDPGGVDTYAKMRTEKRTRAVCPRCSCDRSVTPDGRFAFHNDDGGAWCNGSREAVRR
jgi:hypothetical protein